jgi:hypothetical protein
MRNKESKLIFLCLKEYMTQVQMLAELSDEEEEDLLGEEMLDVEMMGEHPDEEEETSNEVDDSHEEVDEEVSFKKDTTIEGTDSILETVDVEMEEKSKIEDDGMCLDDSEERKEGKQEESD